MTEFHYLYIWSKGQMFIMEKCQPLIWVLGSDLLIIAKFIHVLVIHLMKIHIMVWYLYMLPWIFVLNYVAWWWPSWKSIKHEQYTNCWFPWLIQIFQGCLQRKMLILYDNDFFKIARKYRMDKTDLVNICDFERFLDKIKMWRIIQTLATHAKWLQTRKTRFYMAHCHIW